MQTTLIVTPASLATQWADEFRLHAPTLKVLVYDGWTNVSVPITEEDAEEAREHRQEAETKAKGKGKASVPVRAKTIRQKVRPSVKGPSSSTPTGRESNDAMDVGENAKDEDEEEEILDWCAYVNTFDVCITTYNVLQQDLGVARAPPTRPRRDTAQYSNVERPRSPLVMCEWYRVVMDEVQMVGGGKTAYVHIPLEFRQREADADALLC